MELWTHSDRYGTVRDTYVDSLVRIVVDFKVRSYDLVL